MLKESSTAKKKNINQTSFILELYSGFKYCPFETIQIITMPTIGFYCRLQNRLVNLNITKQINTRYISQLFFTCWKEV